MSNPEQQHPHNQEVLSNTHPEKDAEQGRLQTVIQKIKRRIAAIGQQASGLQSEIVAIRRDFWEDVTVNLEDSVEATETMASIRQQAEVLSEQERSHQNATQQIKTLGRLEYSPYFGRIDFCEHAHDAGRRQPPSGASGDSDRASSAGQTVDQVYIGIASFLDENGEDYLIHDWRAPICSLYYDFPPGPASFTAPGGKIEGTLDLKRQYLIRNGQLLAMFDTGITIGDEILQEALGQAASPQMKSIVSTIQQEQNRLIRDTRHRLLLVKGVAGSGKTSAALQRIAYLLYHERETLTSDNVVLFSPNSLFSSYIANVLPELGEESMHQLTFQEYLERSVGKRFKVEPLFTQTEYLLTQEQDAATVRQAAIEFKSSMAYQQLLDAYVDWLGTDGLAFRSLNFRGHTLIPGKEIKRMFYEFDAGISIPNRMDLLRRALLKELKHHEVRQQKQHWVEDELELLDADDYQDAYNAVRKRGGFSDKTFDDFDEEKRLLAQQLVHNHFGPLRKAVRALRFLDMRTVYGNLFNQRQFVSRAVSSKVLPERWSEICALTVSHLKNRELLHEDATPYVYLQERLTGLKSNRSVRHVFIDEAQDYSAFQLTCIRQMFPHARMTMLGDPNQSIHLHGHAESAFEAAESLFTENETESLVLNKSYRSTEEIVQFTRKILPNGQDIVPFHRSGPQPTVEGAHNPSEQTREIVERIDQIRKRGHRTIAVICRTAAESRSLHARLAEWMDIQLVEEETVSFRPDPLVIPSYLAKGVEFDAVIVPDASDAVYGAESDRTLLYTVCTRAMHELHLFSIGAPSHLLSQP